MRPQDITIEVRDPNLNRVGQLVGADLNDVLITPRANNVGSWSISLPEEQVLDNGTIQQHRLCYLLRQPGHGIIVTGPNGVILSGPLTGANHSAVSSDPGGTWTLSGVSDLIILGRSESWPDPGNPDPSTMSRSNDVRTAAAETLLHQFVNLNIGPGGTALRKNPRLTMGANLGRGPSLTESPRYKNLLTLCQEIATGTSLQFDVLQSGTNLVFTTWVAADRTADVRLDFDNNQLTSEQTEYSAPTATEVKVLGQGEGTERQVVTRTSTTGAAALWNVRIERTLDQRQTDDLTELAQAGDELLAEEGDTIFSFRVVPSGDLADTFEDGDFITVVVNNLEVIAQVTERPISITKDGVFVGATIGDATGFDWESLIDRRVDTNERRISALERNLEVPPFPEPEEYGNVRYGTVTGITSAGVQVTLEDGFGVVVATTRNSRYFPVMGDRVMVNQSGTNYSIQSVAKKAGAIRADLPLAANWSRYNAESEGWNADASGPYSPPFVYRTTNGIVKVSGLIRKYSGAFVTWEKVATIPTGFRPEYPCVFQTYGSAGGVSNSGSAVVDTDGSIYLFGAPSDGAFVSLEGITYPLGLTWAPITTYTTGWAAYTGPYPITGGPTLTFPVAGTALDSNGITWTRGAVLHAAPADATAMFSYPVGQGPIPNGRSHQKSAGHTASVFGYTAVGSAGSVNRSRFYFSGGSRGVFLDGIPFVSESSTLTPYGAMPANPIPVIPFNATIYSGNTNWSPRAFLTPEGMVHMYGLAALPSLATIGWMSNDMRPLYKHLFGAITSAVSGRVDIQANGRVQGLNGTTGWVSMDSIFYMADAGAVDQTYGGT